MLADVDGFGARVSGDSVLSTANMGFTLESPTALSGRSFIEYSCVGAGCEDATGEPEGVFCTIDVPFEATLSE